jgi:23S rRNA (uridine2552-2'-O)-methyltransferase
MAKSSRAWIERHVSDPYVKRARSMGYRSRAAFKLLEIDAQDRLFGRGQLVADLGAAPGGWSQVAAEKVGPGGRVVAVDLIALTELPRVTFIQGDLTEESVLRAVAEAFDGAPLDLVLSDMSPNLSGVAAVDQARTMELCDRALDFALRHLKPNGALLVKTFHGAGFPEFLGRVRARFERVLVRKPGASRSRSAETYLLARGVRRA